MFNSLIYNLYKINAIKFGEFILKSGQVSKVYLDLRQIISYPKILNAIGEMIWRKIYLCNFDVICGVPYTALPIATCISLQQHIPMIMRRKEKKTYGTKQQVEGAFQSGHRCLIVEDVITSGASILESADDIENSGLIVEDVVVLIDRNQGGRENLQQRNFMLHTIFTLEEILHVLFHSNLLSAKENQLIDGLIREKIV